MDADELAELVLCCVAELVLLGTALPATVTGALTLTPFWSAVADEWERCVVCAVWSSSCACPEPPHPAWQLPLLVWVWPASWVVSAELDASDFAVLVSACVAELLPDAPPVTFTGAFVFTPFCVAFAVEAALWLVSADCERSWACPEPPQPAAQLEPLD